MRKELLHLYKKEMIVQIKEIAMRVAKQGRTVGIFWGKKKQMDYSDVFDFGYDKKRRFKNDFSVFNVYKRWSCNLLRWEWLWKK